MDRLARLNACNHIFISFGSIGSQYVLPPVALHKLRMFEIRKVIAQYWRRTENEHAIISILSINWRKAFTCRVTQIGSAFSDSGARCSCSWSIQFSDTSLPMRLSGERRHRTGKQIAVDALAIVKRSSSVFFFFFSFSSFSNGENCNCIHNTNSVFNFISEYYGIYVYMVIRKWDEAKSGRFFYVLFPSPPDNLSSGAGRRIDKQQDVRDTERERSLIAQRRRMVASYRNEFICTTNANRLVCCAPSEWFLRLLLCRLAIVIYPAIHLENFIFKFHNEVCKSLLASSFTFGRDFAGIRFSFSFFIYFSYLNSCTSVCMGSSASVERLQSSLGNSLAYRRSTSSILRLLHN